MENRFKNRDVESELIRVLLIEDNPGDARLVKEMLVDAGASRQLAENIREGHLVARIGGDKFSVVLPNTTNSSWILVSKYPHSFVNLQSNV